MYQTDVMVIFVGRPYSVGGRKIKLKRSKNETKKLKLYLNFWVHNHIMDGRIAGAPPLHVCGPLNMTRWWLIYENVTMFAVSRSLGESSLRCTSYEFNLGRWVVLLFGCLLQYLNQKFSASFGWKWSTTIASTFVRPVGSLRGTREW